MKPRLFKTTLASYTMAPWAGRNESGITPLNTLVLILPDTAAGESEGGIIIPTESVRIMQLAAETGTIVALGDGAFKYSNDGIHQWQGQKPSPGDRVCFERYAGQLALGDDGRNYRIMESKQIGGMWAAQNESVARRDARLAGEPEEEPEEPAIPTPLTVSITPATEATHG